MNLAEYQRSIKAKIRNELDCEVWRRGHEYYIKPIVPRGQKPGIFEFDKVINWLEINKDILVFKEQHEYGIDAELVNYEKYEEISKKEKATKYDKEIQELEQRLQVLKELQKKEIENKKKQKQIAKLKEQLKKLEDK